VRARRVGFTRCVISTNDRELMSWVHRKRCVRG